MDELKEHTFIVLCTDHYNPLGIIRSLGEVGIRPYVVLIGRQACIPASKYPLKVDVVSTAQDGLNLIMRNYLNEKNKSFLLTASDGITALLNERYDELKEHFYFYNCGEQGRLNHFMEKEVLNQLAEECGINVAKRELVKNGEMPKTLRYPIITKAENSLSSNWKNAMHICQNEEELKAAYKKIEANEVLLQEYIVKKNELCIDAVATNNGEDVYMPINSYYYRLSDKSYGYYYYFTKFENPDLDAKIKKMIRKARFTGIFSIEFLVGDDDQLYFLEINWRHSTWGHASTSCGYNLVYSWCKSMITGNGIDRGDINIAKLPFSCMVEFIEYEQNVLSGNLKLSQFIKDVRNSDYLTYWNKYDKGPFYVKLRSALKLTFSTLLYNAAKFLHVR